MATTTGNFESTGTSSTFYTSPITGQEYSLPTDTHISPLNWETPQNLMWSEERVRADREGENKVEHRNRLVKEFLVKKICKTVKEAFLFAEEYLTYCDYDFGIITQDENRVL